MTDEGPKQKPEDTENIDAFVTNMIAEQRNNYDSWHTKFKELLGAHYTEKDVNRSVISGGESGVGKVYSDLKTRLENCESEEERTATIELWLAETYTDLIE